MTIASHIAELKRKHEALSAEVEEAQRSPGVSDMKIADLKKQKLKLKEEISRLSTHYRRVEASAASPAPPAISTAARPSRALAWPWPAAISARVDSSGAA